MKTFILYYIIFIYVDNYGPPLNHPSFPFYILNLNYIFFFYCLCVYTFALFALKQYLLEKGRLENIFMDPLYSHFTAGMTKLLKAWEGNLTPSGNTLV